MYQCDTNVPWSTIDALGLSLKIRDVKHCKNRKLISQISEIRSSLFCYVNAVADPVFPVGGADLRRGCFSEKTYAKTKELDPVGGAPLDPPMYWNTVEDPGFPVGGMDQLGGVDPQHGHFLVKMNAKMKKLDPTGACTWHTP